MGFESEPITSVAIGRLTKGGPQFVVYSAAGKCGTQSSDEYITYAAGYAFNADGTFGLNDYNLSVSSVGGTAAIGPVTFADFNGALAGIDHQRALLERDAGQAAGHDAGAIAPGEHERAQVHVTRRHALLHASGAGGQRQRRLRDEVLDRK